MHQRLRLERQSRLNYASLKAGAIKTAKCTNGFALKGKAA